MRAAAISAVGATWARLTYLLRELHMQRCCGLEALPVRLRRGQASTLSTLNIRGLTFFTIRCSLARPFTGFDVDSIPFGGRTGVPIIGAGDSTATGRLPIGMGMVLEPIRRTIAQEVKAHRQRTDILPSAMTESGAACRSSI